MRKTFTLLMLLAAMLCLPQMTLAKSDPVFGLQDSEGILYPIIVGHTCDASPTLYNHQNLPVTWSSSDETYFTVDQNGIITPLKETGSQTVYLQVHTDGDENYNAADGQIEIYIYYPLYLIRGTSHDIPVTSANASDILGNGKLSYDASTHTLTMNNWSVDCLNDFSITSIGSLFSSDVREKLTVNLVGTNTITNCKELFNLPPEGQLEFTGSGSLTANGDESQINATTLTIDGPTVNLNMATDDVSQLYTNYGVFYVQNLSVVNGGKLHATVSTTVDLSSCGSCYTVGVVGYSLTGDITTANVIWSTDPEHESSINSYFNMNPSDFIGCFFDNQGSAVLPREVEISSTGSVTPPPTPVYDATVTWDASQVRLPSLYPSTEEVSTGVINNIIASLERTDASNYCQFAAGELWIQNNGTLTFKSIVGDLAKIVITCDPNYDVWNHDDFPAEWSYDPDDKTFTWIGTPAEEVTFSGDLDFLISSIEFCYQSAAAPRVGESFYDSWQWYEITGAHTAKVTAPRNLSGSVNIPASVIDQGVTYYITEIAPYAFSDDDYDISNAFIGENVSSIGSHAFDGCTRMWEVTVNSTVLEYVGAAAFKNCLLLQDIEIYTDQPSYLASDAFDGDTRLKHIHVHSHVVNTYKSSYYWSAHQSIIGALYSAPAIGEEFFFHDQTKTGVYEVTSVSPKEAKVLPYPADVNAIYPVTFEGTLIIPESPDYLHSTYTITGIGANAYKDCSLVKSVLIPLSIRSIEAGAFLNCTGVENVFFLWDDPTTVTWADGSVGADFKTAASGNTKIIVPEGKLATYQAWAPAWASCMMEGGFLDVTAAQDPHDVVYYRTFYDSSSDYMLPPDVWAYVGYVSGEEFMLRPIAFDGEILPAGTPVVLRSFTPTYRLISIPGSAPAYTGQNDLEGLDVTTAASAVAEAHGVTTNNIYVLGKEAWIGGNRQEGMGLYRYTGTTLGAHKAYLIYDGPGSGSSGQQNAPARFLFRHEQTPTGVENIQENKAQCNKLLRNGQLIIIKDGKEYNAQGIIIK